MTPQTETDDSIFTVLERAVLYARVSGDDRDKEGRNLQGQLDMGREYAQAKKYNIVDELPEDDKGASGAEIDLPQLNKVREMARAGQFDVLVVREVDRLSRNLAKQLIVEEELNRAGVRVEYVLAEYSDTPEGRLSKHIRATIAEYEREKIRERVVRGHQLSAKSGNVLVSKRPPYGYKVVTLDKRVTLEIVEDEARIVRLIYSWYVYGDEEGCAMSIGAIVRRLTEMRVPTAFDRGENRLPSVKKRSGFGIWNRSVVGNILGRETYIGVWHYGSTEITVKVPAIIDPELWKMAQERKVYNKETSKRNPKYEYLFSKRATCGECGYKLGLLSSTNIRMVGKIYPYYRCPSCRQEYVRSCKLPKIRADRVDSVVWAWLEEFLKSPKLMRYNLLSYQVDQEAVAAPLRERLAITEDFIKEHGKELTKRNQNLREAEERGAKRTREQIWDEIQQIEHALDGLETQRLQIIAQLNKQAVTEHEILEIIDYATELAKDLDTIRQDFISRRRLIEMLQLQITLKIEDEGVIVYVTGRLGKKRLPIVYSTLDGKMGQYIRRRLRLEFRVRLN